MVDFPQHPGAQLEVEITPEMLAQGVIAYEAWDWDRGLMDVAAPSELSVERLVRSIFREMVKAGAKVSCEEASKVSGQLEYLSDLAI